MGCSNSNLHRPSSTNISAEERLLQSHERQLFFSNKKVEDMLSTIEQISFALDLSNFPVLCQMFKVPEGSPSGYFLRSLMEKKQMSVRLLRHLTILLSDNHKIDKFSLIFASDKKIFLNTISDLLHESIEVIPSCLENLDRSVFLYVQRLRPVADQYLRELQRLSLDEIRDRVSQLFISSRDLRYKMYVDLLHENAQQGFDSKFDNFAGKEKNREKDCFEIKGKEILRNGKNQEPPENGKNQIKNENEIQTTSEKECFTENSPKEEKIQKSFEEISLKNQEKHLENEEPEEDSESISDQKEVLSDLKIPEFIKITEEAPAPTKEYSEENFEEKIPVISESASHNDESLLAQMNDSSIKPADSFDAVLEDPKPEEHVEPVESLLMTSSVESPSMTSPVEDLSATSPFDDHSSQEEKSESRNVEPEQKSKIPMRMSSGLASKLKATQAFIRSNTLGKEKSSNINIGYSSSYKQLGLAKMKLSGDAVSAHSAIPLESSLSESSLLRSSFRSRVEEGKNEKETPHKESKIGVSRLKKK